MVTHINFYSKFEALSTGNGFLTLYPASKGFLIKK